MLGLSQGRKTTQLQEMQGRGSSRAWGCPRGRGACSGAASGLWGGAVPRGPITEKADGLLQSPSNPTGIPVSRVFLDMGSGRQPLQLKGVAFVICLSPDLLLPESQAWTSQPPPLSPVAHRPPPLCCMGPAPLNTPISTLPLGSAPQPSCAPALLRCLSATLPALPPQPSCSYLIRTSRLPTWCRCPDLSSGGRVSTLLPLPPRHQQGREGTLLAPINHIIGSEKGTP